MKSVEEQVVEEVIVRLKEISPTAGYRSNLGLSVFSSEEHLDLASAQDPSAVVIARSAVTAGIIALGDGGLRRCELILVIEAYANLEPLGVIADIKQAMGEPFKVAQDVIFQSWTQSPDDATRLKAFMVEYTVEYDERVNDPYQSV